MNVMIFLLQPNHQQAHGREPGGLLLPQHLFPHGHLQIRPLRDRQPPGGRGRHDGTPGRDHGAGAARRGRGQQRGQTVPLTGKEQAEQQGLRWRRMSHRSCLVLAVDLLRHPLPGRVYPGEVRRGDGRPTLGHPHGAALRDADRRRDEEAQHPHPARRRLPLPLGHRQVTSFTKLNTTAELSPDFLFRIGS